MDILVSEGSTCCVSALKCLSACRCRLTALSRNDRGSALVEFGLITAMITLMMISSLILIRSSASDSLTYTGIGLTSFSYQP